MRRSRRKRLNPAAKNFLQQQARFDQFISIFNEQRPHQALNMKYPAELYSRSTRAYNGLPELDYPFHDRTTWFEVKVVGREGVRQVVRG